MDAEKGGFAPAAEEDHRMKFFTVSALLCALLISGAFAESITSEDTDYIVKVVSKLDKYVTWPTDKHYEGNGNLLVISIIGTSPVNAGLKSLDGTESPGGRKFKVRTVDSNDLPANSHILFISGDDSAVVKKAVRLLSSRGTLIIGMKEGFGEMGCMLNFSKSASDDPSKMGVEVNVSTLKEASFQVSPAFLKLARVIN